MSNLCSIKSNKTSNLKYSNLDYYLLLFDFVNHYILMPFTCTIGIVSGWLMLKTLRNKKISLSNDFFIFSQINTIFNIFYSIILLLHLANYCVEYGGFLCEYYITDTSIQYLDIYTTCLKGMYLFNRDFYFL